MATIRGDPEARPIRAMTTPIQPARIETGTYHVISVWKPYPGEYSVTPTQHVQVLPTEGYYMEHNLTVEPIPKIVLSVEIVDGRLLYTYNDTSDTDYELSNGRLIANWNCEDVDFRIDNGHLIMELQ